MPSKKTPTSPKKKITPTDLVYLSFEDKSYEIRFHTFISKSTPEFKMFKKELKNFGIEKPEEKEPVAFPQFYVKSRCDYGWSRRTYPSLISQTPIKNLDPKETIFLTFMMDPEYPAWSVISNKSPFLSQLKKLINPKFHEIPMFPEMISEKTFSGRSKRITYSDFQKKSI